MFFKNMFLSTPFLSRPCFQDHVCQDQFDPIWSNLIQLIQKYMISTFFFIIVQKKNKKNNNKVTLRTLVVNARGQKPMSFHPYSWNSEVKTTWISLIGWPDPQYLYSLGSIESELDQVGSNWIKLDQIGSNILPVIKTSTTFSNRTTQSWHSRDIFSHGDHVWCQWV